MSAATQTAPLARPQPAWLGKLDFLWVELTRKCNLTCVHCYTESSPALPLREGMAYDDWVEVLQQAHGLGCRSVQFIGGEPTLCPDLPRLLTETRRIGFDWVEVYTNGTLLSAALRQSLLKEKIDVAFSVYGSRPAVHDAVTAQPGSFNRTIETIRWALDAGLEVRASIVVMDSNAADVAATRKMLRRLGVKTIEADRNRGIGRGSGLLDAARLNPMGELCGQCWRGKLAVDPAGNVFPCVFSRFCRVGHISESLASILQGEKLHSFRREVKGMAAKKKGKKPKPPKCNPLKKKKPKKCNPSKPKKKGCNPSNPLATASLIAPGSCNPSGHSGG